jgi:hypothetical protein
LMFVGVRIGDHERAGAETSFGSPKIQVNQVKFSRILALTIVVTMTPPRPINKQNAPAGPPGGQGCRLRHLRAGEDRGIIM